VKKKSLTTALLVFFCSFQIHPDLLIAGSSASPLGQIVGKGAQINGVEVASGATLLTDSMVETGESSAFVHLTAGSVLELSRDSAAYFKQSGANAMQVKVHRGALRKRPARTRRDVHVVHRKLEGRQEDERPRNVQ